MSGSTSNISIRISALDLASSKILQLNKTITGLQQPTKIVGTNLQSITESSGLNRTAEGMKTFGDHSLNAARSIERIVGPMQLLTAAGSIAGVVDLAKNWAQAGNEIAKTAYVLNIPAPALNRTQNALKLAGGNAEDAAAGLQSVNEAIQQLAFGQAGANTSTFRAMFPNAGDRKHQEDALSGMRELSKYLETIPAAQRAHALSVAGLSPALMPLVGHGQKAYDQIMGETDKTHGNLTQSMIDENVKLTKDFNRLELDLRGIGNNILLNWSHTIDGAISGTSRWIESNEGLAASWGSAATKFLGAVAVLRGMTIIPWIWKVMGLAEMLPLAALTAVGAGGATEDDQVAAAAKGRADFDKAHPGATFNPITGWHDQSGASIAPSDSSGSRAALAPPVPGSVKAQRGKQAYDYYMSTGLYSAANATGLVGEIQLESGFNPRAVSSAGMPGAFQWDKHRRGNFKTMFGHDINDPNVSDDQLFTEQLKFSNYEMTDPHGEESRAYQDLRKETTAGGSAESINKNYLRSSDYGRPDRETAEQWAKVFNQSGDATASPAPRAGAPASGGGPDLSPVTNRPVGAALGDGRPGLVIPGPGGSGAGAIELNVTVIGAPHGATVTAAGGGTVRTVRSMPN